MTRTQHTNTTALHTTEWLSGYVCPKAVVAVTLARVCTGNRRTDKAITRGSGVD